LTLLEAKDVLQIDATVLAGAFIFFTISSLFGGRLLGLRLISKELEAIDEWFRRDIKPEEFKEFKDEQKSKMMDEIQRIHIFASNYTALIIMVPFALSACAAILVAILQTWPDLQGYFMLVSEISMFVGFIAITLVRKIYDVLVKWKQFKVDPASRNYQKPDM
jgi:hypothetical protein